ncbi:SpaA isopeptide-forming pilin-related protein [Streptomyces niveus]|uniref:SpaA isopeptide-forming pilin-related protein n=1 Tax=Streptomyces niveus TaxID=193462 RepID=UPI00084C0AA1|nr:SpaA isopeptide-forming pilin-related protein [Streptomyces niveus]
MLTRTFAPAFATAAVTAVTGSLLWAPAVSAQTPEPSPSTSVPTQDSSAEAETGGVRILKKDPGGDVMTGAAFTLLDTTGAVAGKGTTDARGRLAFDDLAPGVYRLKETSSGSPLHTTVPDRDVVIPPGTTIPLTVVDPFKPATVLLKTTDDKTGKLLAGSTVNIGTGTTTLLTLTTRSDGTATAPLPVNARNGETFWVRQIKAPAGYDLYKPARTFTAGPGAPVTVTVTNAKTHTTPDPDPSDKPTPQPTGTPSTPADNPSSGTGGAKPTGTPGTDSSPTVAPAGETTPTAPAGSLAHTGSDAAPWLLGAGLLVAVGGGALIAGRRRTDDSEETVSPES